jgi:hypothetical protein
MSPPRFNSQFSFGQDGKLAGRFGLNGLDDLIAGIDEFRASAPTAEVGSRRCR